MLWLLNGIWHGMKTTIDRAGRVVIPADARRKAHLVPGTLLTVLVDNGEIRLVRAVKGPKIEKVDGRLVARPQADRSTLPEIDPARLVEEERDRWPS